MKWKFWISQYTETHCMARGLRSKTIKAYQDTLNQFKRYMSKEHEHVEPDELTASHILDYVSHLRSKRKNGDSIINRTVTVIKNLYRAMVAMGHLEYQYNPMVNFPTMKGSPKKLPVVLSTDEMVQVIQSPPTDTVLGLRDRTILLLLYSTGIRVSECATLTEQHVNLSERTIQVTGKGGHQRVIPLNRQAVEVLKAYRLARGELNPKASFFQSRRKQAMSRNAIYERVRKHSKLAHIPKHVTPHTLRHTFATHLAKQGVTPVVIRDLLGHKQISSSEIYFHLSAEDLREPMDNHPVKLFAPIIKELLPKSRLPFQHPPQKRATTTMKLEGG